MTELTPRQIELLKVIIKEYTESGEPVGSELLEKKYHLGVSPATVRNEMVALAKHEYLKKAYFSSGRVPTNKAFRFYIKYLMEEKELSTADEVASKSDIWDYRDEIHKLIVHATQSLAKRTHMLAAASTNNGDICYFGINYVFDNREFWDVERARGLFSRFDQAHFWENLLTQFDTIEGRILFLLDEEDDLDECASVFGEFETNTVKGMIGVIGPKRMRYDVIVPNIRHVTSLLEDIIKQKYD